MMKLAVSVMVPKLVDGKTKFLVVTRRTDSTRIGFPGGKAEEGEDVLGAAVRELQEETGLVAGYRGLIPVFTGICVGKKEGDREAVDYLTTTFLYNPMQVCFSELDKLRPEEGLSLEWVEESVLTDESRCPFAAYNKEVFVVLDRFYSETITYRDMMERSSRWAASAPWLV